MKHLKKGLYYCQYLVGIGHLVRSLNICRSLVKRFEIDFLLGGQDIGLRIDSSHFNLLQLPSLGLDNPYDENSEFDNALAIKQKERQKVIETISTPYDFLITEIFPFSKWRFKEEIEKLILQLKKNNPKCVIACSLRDSFPKHNLEHENAVVEFIHKYYDVVFVHSDLLVYKLQESFELSEKIQDKLIYTGFIVRENMTSKMKKRKKRIVISLGAGSFGEELVYAVMHVVERFPDYEFSFIKGPKCSTEFIHEITKKLSILKNAELVSFVDHFPEYLAESALSISLGGYTIMDIIYTKTPAIVYPTTFYDQYVRSLKFATFGFLKIVTQEDLEPNKFQQVIEEALKMPPSPFDIDMTGTETTAKELQTLLENC